MSVTRPWVVRGSVLLFAGLAGVAAPGEHLRTIPPVTLTTCYHSRYVTEGRNNLSRGGVLSVQAATDVDGFRLGAWYGLGDREDYGELDLSIERPFALGPLSATLGYTRLQFLHSGDGDNELAATLSYDNLPWLVPQVQAVYSTAAGGVFVHLVLGGSVTVWDGRLSLSPYLIQGFDFGYSTPGNDGPNHLQIGLDASYALNRRSSLVVHAAHSFAEHAVLRDGAGDQTWADLGLAATF